MPNRGLATCTFKIIEESRMTIIKVETFHEAWDCGNCGTKGLSAFNCKQCPTCGAPLDTEPVYKTDRSVENYEFKGHDINCAHCDTRNEKRFSCRNCGASLTDGDDKMVSAFTYKKVEARPIPSTPRAASSTPSMMQFADEFPRREAKTYSRPVQPPPAEEGINWFKYLAIFGGIIVIAIVWWMIQQFQAVKPAVIIVDKLHWSFKLPLEDFQARNETFVTEDGKKPPLNAYEITSRQVHIRNEPVYKDKRVAKTCTKTDDKSNGDGTWSRVTSSYDCSYTERVQVDTKAIWGKRYDFKVNRWGAISPLTREGWSHQTTFPTFTPKPECLGNRPYIGCVRASSGPQVVYTIHFIHQDGEEKKVLTRTMERTAWEKFYPRTETEVILNGFGAIRSIKGVDPDYLELLGEK
jgi:hypothetical protein